MSAPILTLDTRITRKYAIKIDGESYEFRDPKEFTPFQLRAHPAIAARVRELEALETRTPADELEYTSLTQQVCQIILDAPLEVVLKLLPAQRNIVIATYVSLHSGKASAKGSPAPPKVRARKRR